MGLDYSYELLFPREEVWNILEDVGRNAKIVADRQIDIVLPNRRINLPFTSHFKSEPIYFDESTESLSFDTALYCEPDDEIEQYVKEQEQYTRSRGGDNANWVYPRDQQSRVSIGYIYLYIRLHSTDTLRYVNFSFVSASTRMGILFTKSSSMRRAFVQLLESHRGIYGYIQDSDYLYEPEWIYPANCDFAQARELLQ